MKNKGVFLMKLLISYRILFPLKLIGVKVPYNDTLFVTVQNQNIIWYKVINKCIKL